MTTRRTIGALIAVAAVTALSALGTAPARAVPVATPAIPSGSITVSAAASLTDVLPVIAAAFMKKYPGTSVRLNFGGSSALVEQVIAGAPVDVIATASEPTMWKAVNAGHVSPPLLFAKNTMAIALPPGNPARVSRLADLANPAVKVAVCAPTVPCGAAAAQVFAKAGMTVTPVTQELDVRAVLGKVQAGEVDAGLVYVTDVKAAAGAVGSVTIPSSANVWTTYPIATVIGSGNPATARAFANYVRFTTSAQGILRAYGFARPW